MSPHLDGYYTHPHSHTSTHAHVFEAKTGKGESFNKHSGQPHSGVCMCLWADAHLEWDLLLWGVGIVSFKAPSACAHLNKLTLQLDLGQGHSQWEGEIGELGKQ